MNLVSSTNVIYKRILFLCNGLHNERHIKYIILIIKEFIHNTLIHKFA